MEDLEIPGRKLKTEANSSPAPNYAFTAVISNTGHSTGIIDLGGLTLVGVVFPFNPGNVTFSAVLPDSTIVPLFNNAGRYTLTGPGVANSYLAVDPSVFVGVSKVVVNTANAATGDQNVIIVRRVI